MTHKEFIGKIYEPIEKLYRKGFWEWVYGNAVRAAKLTQVEDALNEAMKTQSEPWPEGYAYQNCLMELMRDYELALDKAKSTVSLEKLKGRYGHSK